MLSLYLLLALMIIGAIVAIELKDMLSSAVAVGAVGLILSITFLMLKAPDVAITQLVVEILCLIILIRATLKKDLPFSITGRWYLNTLVTGCFIVLFLSIAMKACADLPPFGYPIMKVAETYLREGLPKTGAANIVAAVILDYRAYDTLGEATVLFTAVIGVLAIVRRIGRKREDTVITDEDES
ncbi:MAG: hydrogen gas-evolving membrane-bound hydrogenase subunit E [Candidatus Omnitrophota bacterium]